MPRREGAILVASAARLPSGYRREGMERNLQRLSTAGNQREGSSMFDVTPQARSELHGMLMRALAQRPESDSPQVGFRLVAGATPEATEASGTSQLGLALDAPREGDEVLEHEGHSVLIVEQSVSDLLQGLTLDVVETPEGNRLGLRE